MWDYDFWGHGGNRHEDSLYDSFKFSWPVANDFYAKASDGEECMSFFIKGLDNFSNQYGVSYKNEYFSNPSKKGFQIKFEPGICILTLALNQQDEPEAITVRAFGFRHIKALRDSIWKTKTFLGLPVLSVFSMDEDFANYPRNFIVTIVPREIANDHNYNF